MNRCLNERWGWPCHAVEPISGLGHRLLQVLHRTAMDAKCYHGLPKWRAEICLWLSEAYLKLRLKPSCDPSSCGHPSIWRLPAEKTQWKHDWQRLASFWLWHKFNFLFSQGNCCAPRWSGELVARNQHLASEKWPWPMKLPLVRCQIQWVP